MKAFVRICMAVPLLLLSHAATAGELSFREDVRAEGRLLFSNGDTAGIERAAEKYRQTQARTPAGFWVLQFFYNGISHVNVDDPRDPAWDKAEQVISQWLKANPQSATAVVVTSEVLSERAWAYRGDGFSSTVTKVGSRKFTEYIERAREILDNNRSASNFDPAWYVSRISVANAQGVNKEDILKLATEALDRYPYYYPIHYVTVNALQPKWGGSQQLVKRYVAIALEHSRAGEGTQAYARIYFQLSIHAGKARADINSLEIDWPRFKESLSEVAAAYPDPWSLNSQRAMACFLWAKDDCKDYITQVDGRYISIAWFDTPQWQKDCVDWTFHGKTFSSDQGDSKNYSTRFVLALGCAFVVLLITLILVRNRRLAGGMPPPIPTSAADKGKLNGGTENGTCRPELSVLKKQCPVCGTRPVEPISGPKGFKSPTHRCGSCSSLLKATFTVDALWSVPIAALSLSAACLCTLWLNHLPNISGLMRVGLSGGLFGLVSAVIIRAVLRGVVLREVNSHRANNL